MSEAGAFLKRMRERAMALTREKWEQKWEAIFAADPRERYIFREGKKELMVKLGLIPQERVVELLDKDDERTDEEEKELDDALSECDAALTFLEREGFVVDRGSVFIDTRITIDVME